jgi:hypothetical protein
VKHKKTVNYIDRRRFYVGMIPDTEQGKKIQQAFQNLRAWRENEMVCRYSGRPDLATNNTNGNPGSSYNNLYPISRFPLRADSSDRQVAIMAAYWANPFTAAGSPVISTTRSIKWFKDMGDALPEWTDATTQLGSIQADGSTGVRTGATFYRNGSVTPTASNDGFRASKFSSTYCYLAALSIASAPYATLDDDQGYFVDPKKFVTYEALRGATTGAIGNSVGRVAWALENGDAMVQATSRCLFQTTYPTGGFVGSAGSLASFQDDSSGNNLLYKVTPRNLGETAGNVEADIAIVVNTIADGDTIVLTSTTGADTWTYTNSGGITTTPTLITTSGGVGGTLGSGRGLEIAGAGDTVLVQAQGADVHVNTVSLWEGERV